MESTRETTREGMKGQERQREDGEKVERCKTRSGRRRLEGKSEGN